MTKIMHEDVDAYFEATLLEFDPALNAALENSDASGLPQHAVSPLQGQFLQILVRATKASRILEIGTLGGYSTICMARALPKGGKLVTLEFDAICAQVATANIAAAGLSGCVSVLQGAAINSLTSMIEGGEAPFDFIFIDADKPSNPAYLEAVLKLSKPGTLIIGDNVVRDGAVTDTDSTDPKVQGVRTFLEAMRQNPNLLVTAMQTVGSKGHDGFSMALVV